jgi:acetylornithine deacetylase
MTGTRYTPKEMLARLIGFDTVSSRSNLALMHFVRDYLADWGVAATLVPSDDGQKANLQALIGPDRPGGIVLSGHTDVVPVHGQPWDTDPFTMVERDGRLYGRGTADMKGFVALALALVPDFLAADLARPIVLAFSYDEEVGCLGAPRLVASIAETLPMPEIVVVGEPTTMVPVNAHKGVNAFEVMVTGRDCHSSRPQDGASAVRYAAELVSFVYRLQDDAAAAADPDSPFVPPYSSFNVGTISGGTALNIVPRTCRFRFDYRSVPTDDTAAVIGRFRAFAADEVLPRLRHAAPDGAIDIRSIATVPTLAPETAGPAEAMACHLTGANGAGVVAYGTEGGLYQAAGMSTIVLGPGDIAQAHQPNEYLEVAQLDAGEAFLRRLIDWARV